MSVVVVKQPCVVGFVKLKYDFIGFDVTNSCLEVSYKK